MKLSRPWNQIVEWTAKHAPRTHASLAPPIPKETLLEALAPFGRPVPDELVALYALAGGQVATERAGGIFNGDWFMPLDGPDGLISEWGAWHTRMEAGVAWATANRFPFAKDFGGSFVCLEIREDDGEREAVVVRIEDGEEADADDACSSLEYFLDLVADRFLDTRELDAPLLTDDVVLFDACKPRQLGDVARHSVLDALGIRATIEGLDQIFSRFDKRPETLFGLAVRLVGDEVRLEHVDVALTDDRDREVPAAVGKSSGGGKPGVLVYAWSKRPFSAGLRLRVKITHRAKS